MRNVRASGAFFPQRKEPEGSCGWGLVELEERLAVTSKSRRLEERLKATLFLHFIDSVITKFRHLIFFSIHLFLLLRFNK